ncbi:MAG TPA: glycosyl hydrolase, partial [Gemmatimonadaceae bacterium]|nr:glycosyl hydrolase [Gemmatimonadaceae bacterium]
DGGDHWTDITRNPGLPDGIWGDIGVTVSGANSKRIWANIEADSGGVFRTDDGGRTWIQTNSDRNLRQRAWYYTKIHADPKDTNVVYDNNVSFMKSTDGGRTFRAVRGMQHGDSHDLWIDPKNSSRMIETDDGGAEVSLDGGKTWSDEDFATAQFYHVIATTHFPYHICGAQQDNSTLCGPSRGDLDISQWLEAGGGESGWIAARADNPDIVYAGSYGNLLTRKDLRTGITANVNPWPDNPMGHPAMDPKYRFQWTFPIVVSKHSSNVVYAGSNVVHKTTNGGRSWTVISPDLTYHDPATLGNSGGPITRDQTSVEYYATVFVIEESPVTPKTIWTGSDDGKIYVTRDGGVKWTDVTPRDMQKFTRLSSIDASKFGECIAYAAANRFQLDDDRPYLWKTSDCGAHWARIDAGLPSSEFTRVVREDPAKRGLLVAGTERGAYFSRDDGAHWETLRLNLPYVPVHDLVFKDGDIVLATHGRGFYIMDDISTLEQMTDAVAASDAHLFKPRDQYRLASAGGFGGGGRGGAGTTQQVTPENAPVHPVGQNPPTGVVIQYWLKSPNHAVSLDFLDASGKLIRSYSSRTDTTRSPSPTGDDFFAPPPPARAANARGVNTFVWNMRYPDASTFPGMILWAASVTGPQVPPGTYEVRMVVEGKPIATETFRILPDPRIKATMAEWESQSKLAVQIRDRFSDANDAVKDIRRVKADLRDRQSKMPAAQQAEFSALAGAFSSALSQVEDSLYQTKNRSGQDPLNYPIRLNNRIGALLGVVSSADGAPTRQSYDVYTLVTKELNVQLTKLRTLMDEDLPKVNAMLKQAGLKEIDRKGPIA